MESFVDEVTYSSMFVGIFIKRIARKVVGMQLCDFCVTDVVLDT